MERPVLLLGEALIDIVTSGTDSVEHVGGSVFNVAQGLAALQEPTTLATWIGDDGRGRRIAGLAAERGVELVAGSTAAAATPVAHATLDEQGVASYRFELEWRLPELPADLTPSHIHTGSFAATLQPGADQVLQAVSQLRSTASVSYDPNIRPALMSSAAQVRGRIEQLIELSDLVKVSDEDLAWLYPDESVETVALRWVNGGPAAVVVTLGAEGAVGFVGEQSVRVRPQRVSVADTVGAGDSFMAGLIAGLLQADLLGSRAAVERLRVASAEQLEAAMELATAAAALTVQQAGAYSPSRGEVGLDD